MSALPLYHDPERGSPALEQGNAGLWYTRFFDRYSAEWSGEKAKSDEKAKVAENAKAEWIATVEGRRGDAKALQRAVRARLRLARALGARSRLFATQWHFVTGLGLPHPVENGFTWHPTLGVPYLCGAAVKGLLRAWLTTEADLDDAVRQERCRRWFGEQDAAGELLVFDALPITPPELTADVMTPHQGKWYEQGGTQVDPLDLTDKTISDKVPGDWHQPVPVPFLVVKQATFLFTLGTRCKGKAREIDEAFELLTEALEQAGAGAKTAVGYGLMEAKGSKGLEGYEKELDEEAKAAARARLSPLERSIEEVLAERPDVALAPHIALFQAVEKGRWSGEDERRVLERIRAEMEEEGRWRPERKKAKQDRDHKRTLEVLRRLGH